MTDKRIKNEQWTVRELLNKVENEFIHKPKYQRKKKWDIIRKKEKNPNIQDYIIFLYNKKIDYKYYLNLVINKSNQIYNE